MEDSKSSGVNELALLGLAVKAVNVQKFDDQVQLLQTKQSEKSKAKEESSSSSSSSSS